MSTYEGYDLFLSSNNKTGYKNVYKKSGSEAMDRPYTCEDEDCLTIGRFATAEEAAKAYAKYRAGEDSRVLTAADVTILACNHKEGKGLRYHVAPSMEWVPESMLAPDLVAEQRVLQRGLHNRRSEPMLRCGDGSSLDRTGVERCCVAAEDASRCAEFLKTAWADGALTLRNRRRVQGYASYGKTLSDHDEEQQRTHTLLFTHALLPVCRTFIPGFADMETRLARWCHERFGTTVSLWFAHGLRQSPETLKSTGFDVHQDTEEFSFIAYTVVVKLTADEPDEPPSAMTVVSADNHFCYGPTAGAAGCFRATLHHASVPPASPREHLKIAFFFRVDEQGERRAERSLRAMRNSRRSAAPGEAQSPRQQPAPIEPTPLPPSPRPFLDAKEPAAPLVTPEALGKALAARSIATAVDSLHGTAPGAAPGASDEAAPSGERAPPVAPMDDMEAHRLQLRQQMMLEMQQTELEICMQSAPRQELKRAGLELGYGGDPIARPDPNATPKKQKQK